MKQKSVQQAIEQVKKDKDTLVKALDLGKFENNTKYMPMFTKKVCKAERLG